MFANLNRLYLPLSLKRTHLTNFAILQIFFVGISLQVMKRLRVKEFEKCRQKTMLL